MAVRPHDLIWINSLSAIKVEDELPEWFYQHWQTQLPVVVRREQVKYGLIPVGIRGLTRMQRLAVNIRAANMVRIATPESLVNSNNINQLPKHFQQTLAILKKYSFPWQWGIVGSCGYQLMTGKQLLTENSDLDLIIRCPFAVDIKKLIRFTDIINQLPCRVDVQVQTMKGGFVLNEWVRDRKVLLRTNHGPIMTDNPWQISVV